MQRQPKKLRNQKAPTPQVLLLPSLFVLASLNRRSENVVIKAVIIAEPELGYIEAFVKSGYIALE